EQVLMRKPDMKKIGKEMVSGLSAIATMFLLAAPFGLSKVITQYTETLGSYEYCTINAYNLWGLLGKNWASQNDRFLSIKYSSWGSLAIVAAAAVSAFVFFYVLKNEKSKYFVSMAIVGSTMFLFSVRMHERYLFPVVVLLLMAFLVRPTREMFFTYVGFSLVCYANVAHVLYYFEEKGSTGPEGGIIGMTALATMAMYAYMFFAMRKETLIQPMRPASQQVKKKGQVAPYIELKKKESKQKKEEKKWEKISKSVELPKWCKKDWIVLGAIMILYSVFALHDLGKASAPTTHWSQTEENQGVITLDLGQEEKIEMVHTYLGNYENRNFKLEVSHDGASYEEVGSVQAVSVFTWNALNKPEAAESTYNLANKYRYIRLTSLDTCSELNELAVIGENGRMLMPVNRDEYKELFDEQDEYTSIVTFREGTYFDEIYHARTAYEMTQGLYNYENTHPPLGKYFISLGVRMFGMNPFGWRIVGTLFGILMLPFMYLFGRRLFRGKVWAAGALTFLFAFDFMHFTQTRIATIDVFGTFFIIAMFYYMYWYSQMSFYDTPLWKTFIPLGLGAIMMGLGCASKWTAVYAAAGLGIFFFAIMGRRIYEYYIAKKDVDGTTNGIAHLDIVENIKKKLVATLAFCVLFYIVIAGSIYVCSYIPFSDGCTNNVQRFNYQLTDETKPVSGLYRSIAESLEKNQNDFTELLGKTVKNANDMYRYHSELNATHPFSSNWYEWPGMYRPMYYYSQTVENNQKEGISVFGNPLVWWAGIPAFIWMLYLIFARKDRKAAFISFAYLVQYVPWMFVSRCIFAYHYFPSVPFVCMMIVYCMVQLREKNEKWFKWILVYLGIAFLLFLLFYPVLSGQPVPYSYVRDALRWRENWILA
ncbi:MAG: glycosyltransferase family 39 protein, partial [Eubacterium sp.]|nr:glycosyltransferase family 39 protein [Eubacterium sp.]